MLKSFLRTHARGVTRLSLAILVVAPFGLYVAATNGNGPLLYVIFAVMAVGMLVALLVR